MSKIPVTVITGFLGAGQDHAGPAPARATPTASASRSSSTSSATSASTSDVLAGCGDETCRAEDMIELSNGCICCTVADEFIPTMETLLDRDDAFDHIVIETSGLALPQPLIRAFNWPEIKARVTIDARGHGGRCRGAERRPLRRRRSMRSTRAAARTRCSTTRRRSASCSRTSSSPPTSSSLNKTDLVDAPTSWPPSRRRCATRCGPAPASSAPSTATSIPRRCSASASPPRTISPAATVAPRARPRRRRPRARRLRLVLDPPADRPIATTLIAHARGHHPRPRHPAPQGLCRDRRLVARLAVQAVGPRVTTWFDRPWTRGRGARNGARRDRRNPARPRRDHRKAAARRSRLRCTCSRRRPAPSSRTARPSTSASRPAPLIFASAADSELALLAGAADRAGTSDLRLANILRLGHNLSVDLWIEKTVRHAKLVVVRLLGGPAYWQYGVDQLTALAMQGDRGRVPARRRQPRPDPARALDDRARDVGPAARAVHRRRAGERGCDPARCASRPRPRGEGRGGEPQSPKPFPRFGLWHPRPRGMVDDILPRPSRHPAVPHPLLSRRARRRRHRDARSADRRGRAAGPRAGPDPRLDPQGTALRPLRARASSSATSRRRSSTSPASPSASTASTRSRTRSPAPTRR